MTDKEDVARRRPLSASMFTPKQAPSLASSPLVVKLARKLAEAQSAALSSFSSAPWRVTAERIEEQPSFVADEQCMWARVESAAGSITFHLGFDRAAVSAFCECAMGGAGTEAAFALEERPLSAIEKEIVQTAGKKLNARMVDALSDQLDTPVSLFDGAIAADDAAVGSEMIVMHFIANVFGYSGDIRVAMPRAELKTQLDAASDPGDRLSGTEEQKAALQRQVSKAECQLIVSLGEETLLVEEIAALVPGYHFRLASTTASPVIVSSGTKPVYAASLARSGEQLAVRITAAIG